MIPGIVLSAGRSRRMGRPKANLPLGEHDTFLTHIVRVFLEAEIEEVVVVVGHDAELIIEAFEPSGLRARFVHNPHYDIGQLSSLVSGIDVIDRPGVAAALVTLVDVPLVTAATVRAVVDCYRRTHAAIVRPARGERHGHPVLFDRALFSILRQSDPAGGAKAIVRAHASEAGDVQVDDDGAFADVDTTADYERLIGRTLDR